VVRAHRSLVLANDSSWTGWGWALCSNAGPIAVGHVQGLGGRAWRWAALRDELERLDLELTEAQALLGPGDPLPRVVVERAPKVYRGRGNQAATGQGIGQLGGAILLWGTRPGRLAYPWELEPGDWRPWWLEARGRRPKGREAWKAWAVRLVETLGWGDHLAPWPWTGDDGGARADVAEAVLLGVGAAQHHRLGPVGPSPARSPAWRPSP